MMWAVVYRGGRDVRTYNTTPIAFQHDLKTRDISRCAASSCLITSRLSNGLPSVLGMARPTEEFFLRRELTQTR